MKKNNNIQEYQKKYDRKEGWNQTKVILANEIKIKNKLYGQFCKTANPERRKQLHESFRNYRTSLS